MALANHALDVSATWSAKRVDVIRFALANAGMELPRARTLAQAIEKLYFVQHKREEAVQRALSALPPPKDASHAPTAGPNGAFERWLAALPSQITIDLSGTIAGFGYWALEDNGRITPAKVGGITAYVREIKMTAACRGANGESEGEGDTGKAAVVFDRNRLPRQSSDNASRFVVVAATLDDPHMAHVEATEFPCVTLPREVAKSRVTFSILGNHLSGLQWLSPAAPSTSKGPSVRTRASR